MSEVLIQRIDTFLEAKAHNPFKRKSSLGPGPRKGKNTKTGNWDCTCADYVCTCDGKDGQETAIVIDKAYKKAYNAEYKKWGPQKSRRKKEKLP